MINTLLGTFPLTFKTSVFSFLQVTASVAWKAARVEEKHIGSHIGGKRRQNNSSKSKRQSFTAVQAGKGKGALEQRSAVNWANSRKD